MGDVSSIKQALNAATIKARKVRWLHCREGMHLAMLVPLARHIGPCVKQHW